MFRIAGSSKLFGAHLAAAALAGAIALPAPATAGSQVLLASDLNRQLDAGYHVAAGDKLRVTVFGEPTLTGEYAVGVGGDLALPLIDAIPAGGSTPRQLAQTITTALKTGGYVLDPRVSVEILLHRPFYILGEVKNPGEYPYSGDLTFEQAVARAGGFTARANRRTVTLRRQNSSEQQRIKLGGVALKIAPGDTITVNESFF
ncbi:polysaccharide export protein [Novosphingobium flavum]|uniref:Polysaccharide export protein n=1 Tax=Novosphingobium flavum TaxID=1778672 RepID=A0A7X1FRJ7_9SPHN|nr:polysaccharide biosynthesis/export family protein [Novosphingobium flavum]MBC2665222.1 polysaccharide export protein [Novosphingobium flavum]